MAITRPRFLFRSTELKPFPTSVTPPPTPETDNQSVNTSPGVAIKADETAKKLKK